MYDKTKNIKIALNSYNWINLKDTYKLMKIM